MDSDKFKKIWEEQQWEMHNDVVRSILGENPIEIVTLIGKQLDSVVTKEDQFDLICKLTKYKEIYISGNLEHNLKMYYVMFEPHSIQSRQHKINEILNGK